MFESHHEASYISRPQKSIGVKWSEKGMDIKKRGFQTIAKRRIIPQTIFCKPETAEDGLIPPKHNFQATKVYILLDEYGHEKDGFVLCLTHNHAISVNINRTSPNELV
jgi:hypothetical protein